MTDRALKIMLSAIACAMACIIIFISVMSARRSSVPVVPSSDSSSQDAADTVSIYDDNTTTDNISAGEPGITSVQPATEAAGEIPQIVMPSETQTYTVSETLNQTPGTTQAEETTADEVSNEMMARLMDQLGPIVGVCGFAYDEKNDLFYSKLYPIQRFFGFNTLYDLASVRVGLYYNTQKIYFTYGGKDWMVQLWKGQYGITVGGEIGMYYKPTDRLIPQYDSIDDEDMIEMQFTLYKNDQEYFTRGPERHWWLTGFKFLDVAIFTQLKMLATFYWENSEQADAFTQGIDKLKLTDIRYVRYGNTVALYWQF